MPSSTETLVCDNCGNTDRFDQLVGFAVNYVTGDGIVVRQLYAEIQEYRCARCNETVKLPKDWETVSD